MREPGTIHFGRVEGSPRLQRVLEALSDGRAHTTLEIIEAAQVCAVNSCIAELRMNGYRIDCKQTGVGRFEYTLAGRQAEAA